MGGWREGGMQGGREGRKGELSILYPVVSRGLYNILPVPRCSSSPWVLLSLPTAPGGAQSLFPGKLTAAYLSDDTYRVDG